MRKRVAGEGPSIEIGPRALLSTLIVVGLVATAGWWLARRGGIAGRSPPSETTAGGGRLDQGEGVTPEGDPVIGAASAPVTIVAYSDYQCPNCRQFATEVLPWLEREWMAQGFVRVVFRDFAIRGAESYAAAHAAHCAGEQGRYWVYHDALFASQSGENAGAFARDKLRATAERVGLDAGAFDACMDADRYRQRIEGSTASARGQGFQGTPTFLVNGRKTQGAIQIADWDQLFRLYQQDFARATGGAPMP